MRFNRDQFGVALSTLRHRFREGEWVEGEALQVRDLAEQCGVSATPIREALSRLAGEGLVEDQRGRGYQARRLDGSELVDLYRAQQTLARLAAEAAAYRGAPPADGFEAVPRDFLDDPVRTWESLFDALMRQGNNGFLAVEQRRLADRLAPARRVESQVLAETEDDFAALVKAMRAADWPSATAALRPCFRRRREAVGAIIVSLRLGAAQYKSIA